MNNDTRFFDIIGSHFVQVFYVEIFEYAQNLVRRGQFPNLTTAYKWAVADYAKSVEDKSEDYKKLVQALLAYCHRHAYKSYRLSQFQDLFLKRFIPIEYYRSFIDRDKDAIMRDLLTNLASDFANIILEPRVLNKIIDNHSNITNVELLQDKICDLLNSYKDVFYDRFIEARNHPDDKKDTIGAESIQKLYNVIREKTIKMKKLDASSKKIISAIVREFDMLNSHAEDLKTQNDNLKTQNVDLLNQNSDLLNQISDLKNQKEEYEKENQSLMNQLNLLKRRLSKIPDPKIHSSSEEMSSDDEALSDNEKSNDEKSNDKKLAEMSLSDFVSSQEEAPVIADQPLLSLSSAWGFGN